MASRVLLGACVILATCAGGGCGTLLNLDYTPCGHNPDSYRVYGGVRHDVEFAATALPSNPNNLGNLLLAPLGIAVAAADLPFCLIGDTLTLPIVVAAQNEWMGELPRYLEFPPSYTTETQAAPPSEPQKQRASEREGLSRRE